ncbi:efflux transporter outer membrane subunit [Acidovorax sp. D4N7]|uniref:Efflux transporter outer membrane subunit n=2 Tax=Comamonas endophytica TaxID=2949090 RepID=A0ABY6GH34_9BURK|nr:MULTISPECIES: efflux transporter outer membrane subunit [unclassified Acidovorax]MCD2513439.1 efflux transporter outer membrane subunit [Acidovorax sp. D4N7]UYG53779.1 efflux transporter outer membrane subunit [Acidovorax sp. 5MLIR]
MNKNRSHAMQAIKTFPSKALLTPLLAALVLAGCASALPMPAEHAGVAVPADFSGTSAAAASAGAASAAAATEAQPRGAWWLAFGDAQLTALVERAGDANTDIQQAAARLAEARALLRSADAQRLPQLGASAGVARQAGAQFANGASPATLGTAGLNLSYEVDLSGRLSRASEAALLDAQARAALLQSTRLMVQADVAQTYLQLRAVQAERALVAQSLDIYRDSLRLTTRRAQAGDAAELDVARMQTEVSATESELLALDRQQAALAHALALLAGDIAGRLELPEGAAQATLPVIPAGVPAAVLARRPDVAAAQATVQAELARVGIAQAAWFPDIALTAQGGYASPELGDLLRWSARSWGLNALLSLPLFDGGRRAAQEEGAKARLEAAVAAQRGQVLTALRDVEDQLSALRLLAAQSEVLEQSVRSAERASHLSDVRWRNGYVSQLELLDARRNALRQRRNALQVRTAQYTGTVMLIRALGGSWEQSGAPA